MKGTPPKVKIDNRSDVTDHSHTCICIAGSRYTIPRGSNGSNESRTI
jgi:hypothetical protein